MQGAPVSGYGGGVDSTVSTVEIRISCRNLASLDYLSVSDPMVRVEQFDAATGRWAEIGRTEWQQNQKNPNFARAIPIDYCFEKVQKLRFQVYDIDRADAGLTGQDFIGESIITLGDILGSPGATVSREIQNPHHPRKNNLIILQAEEVNAEAAKSIITFRFAGTKLEKKDLFGKSDPYLEIYRRNPDGNYLLVHKTEVIKKTLDPAWRSFEIDASKLCQGDFNRRLLFKVWDWDADGSADLIGNAETSMNEMLQGKRAFQLIEPNLQQKKKNYTNSGTLHVHQVDLRRIHSFLDYISGGCQLRLAVAIDYTASNGNPLEAASLHYRSPTGEPNEYMKAIMAIGDIVASYDQTKHFPTYGFGAKIPPTNETSHCFHVNMDPSNPECIGIESVITSYLNSLQQVRLSGPTNFASIIKQVATIARRYPIQQQIYWILLMITDGVISDMEQTIAEMVEASSLPLSIIIVGVGNADFKDMNALDSDDRLLRTRTGKVASRDIVQFVPFRNFKQKHYSELASATLAELPRQLTDFYKTNRIDPKPRQVMPMSQMGLQAPATTGLQAPPTGQFVSGPQGGHSVPPQGAPATQWGGASQAPQQAGWGAPVPSSTAAGPGPAGGFPARSDPQQGFPAGQHTGPSAPPTGQGVAAGGPQQGGWGGQPSQQGGPQAGPGPQQGGWGGQPSGPQASPAPQQGGWGGQPPQQSGPPASPVPQQGGWGGQPSQQGGAPASPVIQQSGPPASPGPQQGAWGGQPTGPTSSQPAGWTGQPSQQGPPQAGPGPQPGGWGQPPQQGGSPASPVPQQGGWGQPPQPSGGSPAPSGQPPAATGTAPQQGGWGGQPPQQSGAPTSPVPQQGGWDQPPQQGGTPTPSGQPPAASGAAPQQGGWGGQPSQQSAPYQQQQWGGGPQQGGPAQGGWGAPQQQGGWGGPQQQQWGGPQAGPGPQQGGWGGAPPQGQWNAPPQYGWGGAPPQQQWGAPPQQGGWGAPQQQGGWGGPSQQSGPYQQQQWGGGPQGGPQQGGPQQQGGWGAAPTQGGAPPK